MNCHCCSREYVKNNFIYHCHFCGHQYRPYEDATEFHTNQYRKSKHSHRVSGEFDKDGKVAEKFHAARKHITEGRRGKLLSHLKKTDYLLDVGSGAGSFANEIRDLVDEIRCLELDPNLVAESRRLGFPTHQGGFLEFPVYRSYDVVTSWHVLEHVEDVNAFMGKVRDIKPDIFWIEVPTERKLKKDFDGHIHMFSKKSFTFLVEKYCDNIIMTEGVQMPALLVRGLYT